jgi:hypothetical protein
MKHLYAALAALFLAFPVAAQLNGGIIPPASILSQPQTVSGAWTFTAHVLAAGSAPALTSCGTSPAISGSDLAGTVTIGTGAPTGCVITFNAAYTSAPHCTVTWRATALLSQNYAVSNTAITLTQTATSSGVVDYICVASSGG